MSKIFLLILIGLTILSCSNDDSNEPPNENCEFKTIISATQYLKAPSGHLTINSLTIESGCLKIDFGASGCSGDSWEINLIDSEEILESEPPQRNLRLSLKNEEACQAFFTKEISFDISSLKVDGNQVQLNITNSKENILYKY